MDSTSTNGIRVNTCGQTFASLAEIQMLSNSAKRFYFKLKAHLFHMKATALLFPGNHSEYTAIVSG